VRGRAAPRWALGSLALLTWAGLQSPGCSEPTAVGTSGTPPADASAQAGSDAGADLAAAAGDSLPTGAISLFNRKGCPPGWEPLAAAAGRTLIPTAGDSQPGATSGQPLEDGEDRQHSHGLPVTLNLPSVTYAGVVGEANHGVARAGSLPLTVVGDKASSGLPYVQLLVCQKQAAPDLGQRPAPTGTLMFFQTAACPAGWGQAGSTQGRVLIGLPEDGTPGQKFGGKALGADEKRTHHHKLAGKLQTSAHGIALLSGGAAGGYARDGEHAYDGTSDEQEAQLPSLQLLQCQKL